MEAGRIYSRYARYGITLNRNLSTYCAERDDLKRNAFNIGRTYFDGLQSKPFKAAIHGCQDQIVSTWSDARQIESSILLH